MKIIERDSRRILRNSAKVMLGSERYNRNFIVKELAKISLAMDGDKTENEARGQALRITEATVQDMYGEQLPPVAKQQAVMTGDDDLPSDVLLDMGDLVDDTLQL